MEDEENLSKSSQKIMKSHQEKRKEAWVQSGQQPDYADHRCDGGGFSVSSKYKERCADYDEQKELVYNRGTVRFF